MTRRRAVGDHALEVEWHGPPPGEQPTLVFLHEGLGSVSTWRSFPSDVADGCGLGALVYSRRGYGGSDPITLPRPLSYMHDEARDDLPALLDALSIARAILVGHSDGASIALVHAAIDARTRRRVKGLALIAPHVFVEEVSVRSIAAAKASFEEGPLAERLRRHHGANTEGAFRGWNDAWLDPAFRTWDLTCFVRKVVAPMLVVQGEADEYGTWAQVEAIERAYPSRLEARKIEGAGHAPQRDRPSEVTAAIAAFVRSIADG